MKYLLKCSVCNGEFNSKESWTRHLIETSHLLKARQKCRKWSLKRRRHCLVAYAGFPLSSPEKALGLLQKISKDLLTFVTDFVWMEGIPRVGLIQFESRDRMTKFLTSLGFPVTCQTEVDGSAVAFRKATDLMDLEWQSLIEQGETLAEAVGPRTKQRKRKMTRSPQVEMVISSTTDTQMPQEVVESAPTPAKRKVERKKNIVGLREMFDALLETVKIPDSEFRMLQEFQCNLERTCRMKGGRLEQTRVILTDNWFLQLQPSPTATQMPSFVFYKEGSEDDPDLCHILSLEKIGRALKQKLDLKYICSRYLGRGGHMDGGISSNYIFQTTGLHFIIANHLTFLNEFQRRRLLQYYFNFEPRLKDLIGLINVWSSGNNIVIYGTETQVKKSNSKWVLEPSTLECLLMTFLCREKLVPSLRELQSMPHKRVILSSQSRRINLGFCDDPEFAQNWSGKATLVSDREGNGFILSVLELASNFFSFCSILDNYSTCVVNIKDGEILSQEFFQTKVKNVTKSSSVEFSALTPQEISSIRQLLFQKIGLKTKIEEQIIVTNHFDSNWYILINRKHFQNSVCPIMKATSVKLKEFVQKWTNKSQEIEFSDLKDSLVCSTSD